MKKYNKFKNLKKQFTDKEIKLLADAFTKTAKISANCGIAL